MRVDFPARFRQPGSGAARRPGDRQSERHASGVHDRLIRRQAAFLSRAETLARSPSTARSTISQWAALHPLFLSAAFIIEEGLPIEILRRVVELPSHRGPTTPASRSSLVTPRSSRKAVATSCSSTQAASAVCPTILWLSANRARPGDKVLLSGSHRRTRNRDSRATRGTGVRMPDRERQRRRCTRWWPTCSRSATKFVACAILRAAACRVR